MSGDLFLFVSTNFALAVLTLALLLAAVRLLRGPTLADRVLSLDLMTTIAIGYVGVIALRTGVMLYLDIAIAIGLVGFLGTIAFARYILVRGAPESVAPPLRAEAGDP